MKSTKTRVFPRAKGLALATLCFGMAGSAHAFLVGTTPLANSSNVVPGLVPIGTPAGGLIATSFTPWTFTTTAGTSSGTFRTAVYVETSGTLDFYYQVTADPTSATAINRAINVNFAGFTTYVGYRLDGAAATGGLFQNGTVIPTTADRNASGSVVGFNFDLTGAGDIGANQSSVTFVISTDATNFTLGNTSLIDGGSTTLSSFAPTSVPEPATMAALGFGALALIRRKRA